MPPTTEQQAVAARTSRAFVAAYGRSLNAATAQAGLGCFCLTDGMIREYVAFLHTAEAGALPRMVLFTGRDSIVRPRAGSIADVLGSDPEEAHIRETVGTLEAGVDVFLGRHGIKLAYADPGRGKHTAPDWLEADMAQESYFPPQAALEFMDRLGDTPAFWARNLAAPGLVLPGLPALEQQGQVLLLHPSPGGAWEAFATDFAALLAANGDRHSLGRVADSADALLALAQKLGFSAA